MIKGLLICAGVLALAGCGGASVDQKALSATNTQCKDNGGIYSVYFSEGLGSALVYVYCKDGSTVTLAKGKDW